MLILNSLLTTNPGQKSYLIQGATLKLLKGFWYSYKTLHSRIGKGFYFEGSFTSHRCDVLSISAQKLFITYRSPSTRK